MPRKFDLSKAGDARRLGKTIAKNVERGYATAKPRMSVEISDTTQADLLHRGTIDTTTAHGLRCVQLLNWLCDYRKINPNLLPQGSDYLGDLEPGDRSEASDSLLDVATILEEAGLIKRDGVMGSPFIDDGLILTEAGVTNVVERRHRRADDVLRVSACRRAILKWLYRRELTQPDDENALEELLLSPLGNFEGT